MVLKMAREKKRMTQEQLAEAVGVSRSTIAMIENGTNQPSLVVAKKIASVLDMSIEEIF